MTGMDCFSSHINISRFSFKLVKCDLNILAAYTGELFSDVLMKLDEI